MAMEDVLRELGNISLDAKPSTPPIFIVSREGKGDGSGNWTEYDRPGISVFTSQAELEKTLMSEEGFSRFAVRRAIRLGGFRLDEFNWVRITQTDINPSELKQSSDDWELPSSKLFIDRRFDSVGASRVLMEFLYNRNLAPTKAVKPLKRSCFHSHFSYRSKESFGSDADAEIKGGYVQCDDMCGFRVGVEKSTEHIKWRDFAKCWFGWLNVNLIYIPETPKRSLQEKLDRIRLGLF